MAKDPAFLFYPNDYIGGTMGMTFEEKGAYMELLMMQFNRGHMTEHMIRQTVGQLWDTIEDKFDKDVEGLFFNKRLEDEKLKRQKYTESRRNNKSGNNQHTKKPKKDVGHMTEHMEDENEDVNIIKSIIEYLNNSTGKSFKYTSTKNKDVIRARLNEKYTLDDFKKVIDTKCKSWLGDENMIQYLRPETLFSNKFEGYLNEIPTQKQDGPKKHKVMYLGGGVYHYHTEQEIKDWCQRWQTKVHQKF